MDLSAALDDRPIVVGVDASPATEPALAWAVAETTVRPRPLVLVHEVDVPVELTPRARARARAEALDHGAAVLTAAEKHVRELGVAVPVRTLVETGSAGSGLLDRASHAAMLVVGHRAWAGAESLLHASVAAHVSAQAGCPVVVVRGWDPAGGRRIVVGMELSGESTGALRLAFEEAALRGAPLLAVHGYLPDLHAVPVEGIPPVFDESVAAERDRRLLDAELSGWQSEFPDVEVELSLRRGNPARLLAEASTDAALLVVGSHGGRALARRLLGSVSLAVLRHARCPVAVVRP